MELEAGKIVSNPTIGVDKTSLVVIVTLLNKKRSRNTKKNSYET